MPPAVGNLTGAAICDAFYPLPGIESGNLPTQSCAPIKERVVVARLEALKVTFEVGFADTERAATVATKTVATLAAALKQLQRAAVDGDLSKMRRASERLAALLESTRQEVANARAAWPFTPEAEEAYLRTSYAREIIEAAKPEGLKTQQRDEGLVVFPSILRSLPAEHAVRIDRKKVQAIRPSRLVKALKAIQTRKPYSSRPLRGRFHPGQLRAMAHSSSASTSSPDSALCLRRS